MKLLGHAWVAVYAYPKGNRKLLILGSVLPEIMFYTKNHPFEYDEIHEGGDMVYRYLRKTNPQQVDLGLGMLTHSVKAGADYFNFDDSLALLGYTGASVDEVRNKLAAALKVSCETAKTRAHNILELAVEVRIIRDNPEFVSEFTETLSDIILRKQASDILSDCFSKPKKLVAKSVVELLDKAKPEYFTGAKGLAGLWAELSKDFDPPPDKKKLTTLLQELSDDFSGKDKMFLDECIAWTKKNIENVAKRDY